MSRDEDAAGDYRALLERVPAIMYIADVGARGRWHYVSPQIETILGYSAEDWQADPELWAQRLHPADRDGVIGAEETHSGTTAWTPSAAEYRMLHRDGHVVWIRDDACVVRNARGQLRWHGVLSDITEAKQAEAELELRAAQQAAVARLGQQALRQVEISELIEQAVASAVEILGVEIAAVAELEPGRQFFQLRAGRGWPRSAIGDTPVPAGAASQAGWTLLTGSPVVVTDWSQEHRFAESPAREIGARSGLTVSIDGREAPFGIFGVHSFRPREYGAGDIDFVQSLANVLADALDRQATEDDIQHRSLHDPLTGLPNRILFLDRLEHTLTRLRRSRRSLAAMLSLDIDHFKLVNDSLGHPIGDELLSSVAARLKQAVRASDTVARFGGDEFGILLEEIDSERDAIAMAESVAGVFARPFVLNASDHFVTTSIGIALARGGEPVDELIRDADTAMYRAKERGRGRYELFDDISRGRALARLRIENDLRRAIERGELRLDYQPVVSLREEQIVGVEALLRWEHPERGLIGPSEFVPVAEETGLIQRIGRWALEAACRQATQWTRMRQDVAPLGLGVNISPLQLSQRGFPELVVETLQRTGLDPSSLRLEITESVLLEEAEHITQTLSALKRIGVRLVLDDFGTGYSSLGYLIRLQLDGLKVDRSFVDGLGRKARASAITEAIIAMARALELQVVGEGVETEVQLAELRRLGCDLVQGYHFSPAVSARELTTLLRDGAPWIRTPVRR